MFWKKVGQRLTLRGLCGKCGPAGGADTHMPPRPLLEESA
jgi:hypothetical protein